MIRIVLIASIVVIAATMPVMAQQRTCVQLRQEYDAGPIPKAYAASPDGHCGFASVRTAPTLAGVKAKALEFCAQYGGVKCAIVSSQGK